MNRLRHWFSTFEDWVKSEKSEFKSQELQNAPAFILWLAINPL
jgi:hypothetical protein